MKIEHPIPLCGTPDVIWQKNGTLIVGDYKSRTSHRVYTSDIIQLSVYRLLLRYSQPKPVANYGFIHFHGGSRIKVSLWTEKEIVRLYQRYLKIMGQEITPAKAFQQGYCRLCSQRKRCS